MNANFRNRNTATVHAPAQLRAIGNKSYTLCRPEAGSYELYATSDGVTCKHCLAKLAGSHETVSQEWRTAMPDTQGNNPGSEDPAAEFTVPDAAAWLGIDWADYLTSGEILKGRHGNPLASAMLDARAAQGTATTAAEVLARHGIDPADPLAAVRRYDKERGRYDR